MEWFIVNSKQLKRDFLSIGWKSSKCYLQMSEPKQSELFTLRNARKQNNYNWFIHDRLFSITNDSFGGWSFRADDENLWVVFTNILMRFKADKDDSFWVLSCLSEREVVTFISRMSIRKIRLIMKFVSNTGIINDELKALVYPRIISSISRRNLNWTHVSNLMNDGI
jgi:hypothetical protein